MKIHAPNPEFLGKVGEVSFIDGVAEVDSLGATTRAFFARNGYVIDDDAEKVKEPTVAELKEQLAALGLDTEGKKADLVERLAAAQAAAGQ